MSEDRAKMYHAEICNCADGAHIHHEESEDGDWVKREDYVLLQNELARIKEENELLRQTAKGSRYYPDRPNWLNSLALPKREHLLTHEMAIDVLCYLDRADIDLSKARKHAEELTVKYERSLARAAQTYKALENLATVTKSHICATVQDYAERMRLVASIELSLAELALDSEGEYYKSLHEKEKAIENLNGRVAELERQLVATSADSDRLRERGLDILRERDTAQTACAAMRDALSAWKIHLAFVDHPNEPEDWSKPVKLTDAALASDAGECWVKERDRLKAKCTLMAEAINDCISALAWLPEDNGPVRKRAGEAIQKARAARDELGLDEEWLSAFHKLKEYAVQSALALQWGRDLLNVWIQKDHPLNQQYSEKVLIEQFAKFSQRVDEYSKKASKLTGQTV